MRRALQFGATLSYRRGRQLKVRRQREPPLRYPVEVVLVLFGHFGGPEVDGLPGLEAAGMSQLLSAAEVLDRVGLLHKPDGKRVSQRVSSPFTTGGCEVIHNPAMKIKKDDAHDWPEDTLAQRMAKAIKLKDTNPNQIEQATGITRQTFYAVLSGETQNLSGPVLVKSCEYLGVRHKWMADGELPMYPTPKLEEHELQLIEHYRHLSEAHQKDLRDIAERWSEEDDPRSGRTFAAGRPRPRHQ